jgi:hypothetical protein
MVIVTFCRRKHNSEKPLSPSTYALIRIIHAHTTTTIRLGDGTSDQRHYIVVGVAIEPGALFPLSGARSPSLRTHHRSFMHAQFTG